jgi:hypothetical protein
MLQQVLVDAPDERGRKHRASIAATLNELVRANNRVELPVVDYAASIQFNAAVGSVFLVIATNGVAFTIEAPLNGVPAQRILVVVKNSSGGALGAITWNAVFKKTAFTNPANGFSRSIEFVWDGTNWIQTALSGVDVPN